MIDKMITRLLSKETDITKEILYFPFNKKNKVLNTDENTICIMKTKKCGSMRFRWNEKNENRNKTLQSIKAENKIESSEFSSVELVHSKRILCINEKNECNLEQADGIITQNKCLIPVVTVADCMPLYIFDDETKVFGVLHSGWKGTGIVEEAVNLFCSNYKSQKKNICVVIGPHIHECCYIVDSERASYFVNNFGTDCVKELEEDGKCFCGGRGLKVEWNNEGKKLFRLSLKNANLNLLEKCGIYDENIAVYDDCTCCNDFLGSNRRESSENKDSFEKGLISQSSLFTVMATGVINKV